METTKIIQMDYKKPTAAIIILMLKIGVEKNQRVIIINLIQQKKII